MRRRIVVAASTFHQFRHRMKIIQRRHPRNNWRQRRRYLRIAHVGIVRLAQNRKQMDRCMKRALHLPRGSGKLNRISRRRRILHFESLRLQPALHRLQIRIGNPKLRPISRRRHPLMKRRRPRVLHVRQILRQLLLLRRTPLEHQHDSSRGHRRWRYAAIEPRLCHRMNIPSERNQVAFVNWRRDAIRHNRRLSVLRLQRQTNTRCGKHEDIKMTDAFHSGPRQL